MSDEMNTTKVEQTSAPVAPQPVVVQQQSTLIKDLAMPVAVVLAGAFIGLGFFFSGTPAEEAKTIEVSGGAAQDTTDAVREVTADEHIKGSIDAKVTIVEYSDFECPFCKQFHETLQSVVSNYDSDEVAWVFRQFPLEQLHPVKARAAAMASECVAELGGNDAFWQFTDGYFEVTLTNNRTDIETVIPQLVTETGVDRAAFTECFESEKYADKIDADIQNAVDSGGRGTPWSVVIGPDGKTYPLNGSQPAAAVTAMIDRLLAE